MTGCLDFRRSRGVRRRYKNTCIKLLRGVCHPQGRQKRKKKKLVFWLQFTVINQPGHFTHGRADRSHEFTWVSAPELMVENTDHPPHTPPTPKEEAAQL